MLITRLAALSVLMTLSLPACDPKPEPGDGDDNEAADAGDIGAEDDEDDEDEPAPQVVEDFGQAGAVCDQSVLSAACQEGGVAGLEFCDWDDDTYSFVWTECLTETCSEAGGQRACEGGVAYCATHTADVDSEVLRWGVCGAPGECTPGDSRSCWGEDEFEGSPTQGCTTDEYGRPMWDIEACNTPLVLSFGDDIAFAEAPVAAADFDIHGGSGTCARADWPTAQTPWLALDRDGNGSIDGGQELFGSATRLSAGTGPHNGFQALAELDSDGDGKVTPVDARWGELVLWADHDADRRSSGWELLPLASFEILEIDLGYDVRRACDARGNCGLERARFVYRTMGREHVGEVVDVRVSCEG
jgi:hypothetical protein